MSNNKITTLAAIRSFYDNGNDVISVFSSLVLKHLSDNTAVSICDVQKIIHDEIGFDVPEDIVRTIIKRLHKRHLVYLDDIRNSSIKSIKLLDDGRKEKVAICEKFRDAEREKEALIMNIKKQFDDEFEMEHDIHQIEKAISFFIEKNSHNAILYLEGDDNASKNDINDELQVEVAKYFMHAEKSDPVNFKRLKSILYGSILSRSLLIRGYESKAKFNKLVVYLDTNMVFSVLGFHEDFYNKPAQEIFAILKDFGCDLRIFSFTEDEIIRKLKGFLSDYGIYNSQTKVNSMYSVLCRKGYTKSSIFLEIEKIDEKLNALGIDIDYAFSENDVLIGIDEESRLMTYGKKDKTQASLRHDIAAIYAIRKLRGKKLRHFIEKSEYIFLTADHSLARYDYDQFHHKDNSSVPEVLFRTELASILWLKDIKGADNALVHSFFINYAISEMISDSLWRNFIQEIKSKKELGSLTDDDISLIISHEDTERILNEEGEKGFDLITDQVRIQGIRDNYQKSEITIADQQKKDEIQEKQITLLKAQLDKSDENAAIYLDTIRKVNDSIKCECKNFWEKVFKGAMFFVVLSSLFGAFLIFYFKKEVTVTNYITIGTIVFAICVFACFYIFDKPIKFSEWLSDKIKKTEGDLINRCIKKKKNRIQLSED